MAAIFANLSSSANHDRLSRIPSSVVTALRPGCLGVANPVSATKSVNSGTQAAAGLAKPAQDEGWNQLQDASALIKCFVDFAAIFFI